MKKYLTVSNIVGVFLAVAIIVSMLISKHSLWVMKKQITTCFGIFPKKQDTPPAFFADKDCTETSYNPELGTTKVVQWQKGKEVLITKYDKTEKIISKEFKIGQKQGITEYYYDSGEVKKIEKKIGETTNWIKTYDKSGKLKLYVQYLKDGNKKIIHDATGAGGDCRSRGTASSGR